MMETTLGPAGLALCYDLRFPELFRWCARRDAALFLLPAQWPHPRIGHWRLLCQARAVENLAFLVGVNAAGDSEIDRLYGHSIVVDPWGEVLWEPDQEEVVGIVDLEPERLTRARGRLNVQSDAREDLLAP
jgi:predicted amidohydrolase